MADKDQVLAVIGALCGRDADSLKADDDLIVDLDIDSPKALELLVELEDLLGLEISDEQAAGMESVGDILAFVEGHSD